MRPLLAACLLLAGGPAPACDISRWPSTARVSRAAPAPAHTAVAARYTLARPPGAAALEGLAAALPAALDDDEAAVTVAERGASLIVWAERIPADWSAVDAVVAGRAPGARRAEIGLAVCLPPGADGEIAPPVRRAVLDLPELRGLPIAFEEGAARIRFTGGRLPAPALGMRLHLAALAAAAG